MSAVGIQLSSALSALNQPNVDLKQIFTSDFNPLSINEHLLNRPIWVGAYPNSTELALADELQVFNSRNLRFALLALQPILTALKQKTAGISSSRLAIVLGTS